MEELAQVTVMSLAQMLTAVNERIERLSKQVAEIASRLPPPPVGEVNHMEGQVAFRLDQMITLDSLEGSYIAYVLSASGGNKTQAAEVLGVDPSTLYRKLSRIGGALPPDRRSGT
jgi:DNA-binding NtrC family response regulator